MSRMCLHRLLTLMTILGLLVSVITGSLVAPVPVLAAGCDELQIAFLIDQSGSMGGRTTGSTVHPEPNDSKGLRFLALQTAVQQIGPLLYHLHPGASIRIARVDFGERPELGFGWTLLNPTNADEWNQQLKALDPSLKPGRWEKENLGGTDFLRALQYTDGLFKQLGAQTGECPFRSIIILTDGRPDIPGINLASYFKDLEDYRNKYLPATNYEIRVVAMNDSADNYWPDTQPFWLRIAGNPDFISQVKNQDDVVGRFSEITQKQTDKLVSKTTGTLTETKPPEYVCPGPVPVQPYLQWVSFTVVKQDPKDHLILRDELGPVDSSRKDMMVLPPDGYDGYVETVRVTHPLPGVWQVTTTMPRARCDIEKLAIPAAAKIISSTSADQLAQFVRVNLTFQILDIQGQGVPLPDYDPRYALDTKARIASNTGVQDLALVQAGKNTYSSAFVPTESGPYSLEVIATSQDVNNNPITVTNQTILAFQIPPVRLIMLQGPGADPLPSRVPISITVAPAGPSRKPVRLELPPTITATISTVTQTQTLALSPQADGSYGTVFTPGEPGAYRLSYQGTVVVGSMPQTISGDDVRFDVYAATILHPRMVSPTQNSFEATGWLGQALGLSFDYQIVDENNQTVDPALAFDGEPLASLTLRVVDSHAQDRTREVALSSQDAARLLFRGEAKTFGADQYTVQLTPNAKLKKGYVWAAPSWKYTFNGTTNPGFYALAFVLALLAIDALQWGAHWAIKRPHPLRGWLFIAQQVEDEPEPRIVWRKRLPSANVVRFKNGFGWKWLLPWWYKDFPPKLQHIRGLEVRSTSPENAQAGVAQIAIRTTQPSQGRVSVAEKNFILRQDESLGGARDIGYGFSIYLQ